eukprot:906451-Prymnesium_polylepis.1
MNTEIAMTSAKDNLAKTDKAILDALGVFEADQIRTADRTGSAKVARNNRRDPSKRNAGSPAPAGAPASANANRPKPRPWLERDWVPDDGDCPTCKGKHWGINCPQKKEGSCALRAHTQVLAGVSPCRSSQSQGVPKPKARRRSWMTTI